MTKREALLLVLAEAEAMAFDRPDLVELHEAIKIVYKSLPKTKRII